MNISETRYLQWLRGVIYLCLLCFSSASVADKEFMDDWHIFGSNTVRGSMYDAYGPGSGSPYPFEGPMLFDEFNVYLSKQITPYDQWRGEVSGVVNAEDRYRSNYNALVPERINFTRENGDGPLPYRLEIGDYFSYYSFLTLQRSLKGVQVELQPVTDNSGRKHSIIFTVGADEGDWRSLTPKDNFTAGLSWLIQDEQLGSLSLNYVHNFRDNSNKLGTKDRNQYVFSIAGEKPFSWFGQNMLLEGEAAHFSGDHNGIAGPKSGQDRSDNGYYLQLTGHSMQYPWDYRLRFDDYGQDFRPEGAVVTPDRRSIEAHTGWRFDSGVRLRARAQLFEDNFETSNKLRTRTYGINMTGPLLKAFYPDVTGSLDGFVQISDDEAHTVSTTAKTINLNLNKPLPYEWNGRLGVFYQNIDDSAPANADNLVRQVNFNADHPFSIAGFTGYITPGLLLRTVRHGGNDSTDWGPSLALHLRRDRHELNMDYGGLMQNRKITLGAADVDTHTLNIDYRYNMINQQFGIEANLFSKDPSPGDSTEAYRISAYWTYNFDRPPVATRPVTQAGQPLPAAVEAKATVAGLAPGFTVDKIQAALQRDGISGGVKQAGYIVYEHPLLADVFQRQRMVLQYEAGTLERSALIIDFDDVGNRDSVTQTFERIRQELIRQLGTPTRTFQEGDFTESFVSDVNEQRLIRITEWETDRGTIRFGIPRRLDRQVRMEIQYARSFPQPRETLWSIEAVR